MIDAHQHFWRYAPATHAWIDASMGVLKRDFLPPDLAPLLAANGFDGCIAVQAAQTHAENDFLLALADEHAFIRSVVGWVDLCASDVERQLERYAAHPRFKGVRHIVQSEPDPHFLARADFGRGIAALASHDLAYDVLVYAHQLPAVIEFVDRFPAQRFVLDHGGKPRIAVREREPWATHVRALARRDHVSCKLSGLVTEADRLTWTRDDLAFYADTLLEAFGPRRLMIGSDWPVCTLAGTYADVVRAMSDTIANLSISERAAVQNDNALRFYRCTAPGTFLHGSRLREP